MKKALVILLTLALAGGVFAQTVNVGGFWEGGVAITNNTGWDDPIFGAVAPNAWTQGTRGELRIGGTNADGNAGFTFWLRASGNPVGGMFYRQAFGWVRLFDNMLELRGGRIHEDRFATQDWMGTHWVTNYHGLVAYINATDTIRIGVGAYSPTQGEDWEGAGLALWGGLGVQFGLGEFRTSWRINHAHATLDNSTDGLIALNLLAIDNIPIHASLRLMNVNDFNDNGRLDLQAQVGLNLVQDFAITATAAFSMSQVDDTDPFMAFGGWLIYNGLGNIVPRLDVYFVSGGEFNFGYGFHPQASALDYACASWNSDQSYFHIRPQVQIRATANAWWEIGAFFNFELGDVGAAGGTDDDPLTFGLFTGVRVLF